MTEKLLVPDIGDFENVEVIEILVKEGQIINKNDPIVTIESDKSSVEIPSTFSGKIDSIKIKVGDKISKGDLILSFSNSNQSSISKVIPKDTENLIQEAENALKKVILKEDIIQIKIQKISRKLAKEIIPTQLERKECLRSIMNDNHIDQLIKDGQIKKAEKRATEIIKKWK